MQPNIEVKKQDNTNVVSSTFEVKVPYTHTDDYGNTGEFFKKEIISETQLTAQKANLTAQQERIDSEIELIDEKLSKIAALK